MKVFKYGDNVDTDVIIPGRYLNITDMKELSAHCMEDLDKSFGEKVTAGDVIVAGKNFGCGSSREHAPAVIKESGVSLVIAESFARIFYRNALNIGLPILECAQAAREIKDGDEIEYSLTEGTIKDITSGKTFKAVPFPGFIMDLIKAGGLMEYAKKVK